MNELDNMPPEERMSLRRLPDIPSWECVLEEVLDTDDEIRRYTLRVNELICRGYTKEAILVMRDIAWQTAGWFNFEMLAWDYCGLTEEVCSQV